MKPLSVGGREFLRELSLPTPWDALLTAHLEIIETLIEEIERLEATIEERTGSLEHSYSVDTLSNTLPMP